MSGSEQTVLLPKVLVKLSLLRYSTVKYSLKGSWMSSPR